MFIEDLVIKDLRILDDVKVKLSSGINVFVGANGSGKTSLLEAISILSQGRSFKTNRIEKVIQNDKDALLITASFRNHGLDSLQHIGIEKKKVLQGFV